MASRSANIISLVEDSNTNMAPHNQPRSKSTIDPQRESSAAASLRARLQKSASSPTIHKGGSRPRSTSSATAADSGVSIKSKPALAARDWYFKKRPETKVYKGHAIVYGSARTRPAVDLMREILEVRYPEPHPDSGMGGHDGATGQLSDEESTPLLMTTPPQNQGWLDHSRCGWTACARRWKLFIIPPGRREGRASSDAHGV